MASLTIKKSSNFDDVENYLQRLVEDPNFEVRLPNSIKEKGVFGLEGLLLLFLATWIRKANHTVLHTFANSSEDFDDLCNSLYGICALRISDQVLLEHRAIIKREDALRAAYTRIRSVINEDYKLAFKGSYIAIPSIKAPGNKSIGIEPEFNNPFYNGELVVGKDKFRDITIGVINSLIPESGRRAVLDAALIDNIAEIIRELFTNTHKHARRDADGNVFQRNFRAVIFNVADVSRGRLDKLMNSGNKSMFDFNIDWLPEESGKLSVLDITVVDSGPGYARHWTSSNGDQITNFPDEANAVASCFSKHHSKDGKESYGSGLSNVLHDLKVLKGLFRLRTGKCYVEKSFLFPDQNSDQITLKDVRQAPNMIEGVSFNFVIPLRKSGKRA